MFVPVATRLALGFVTSYDLQRAMHQDDANAAVPFERFPKEVHTIFRSST
jgi:hypothetical protein